MLLNIPTRLKEKLHSETYTKISKVEGVTVVSKADDFELISVMADGRPLQKVIDIALESGIAE